MAKIDDYWENVSSGVQDVYTSSFIQEAVSQQQQVEFQKAMDAYNKKKFNLTHKEIDSFILAIASGKNTYQDLQGIMPELNSPTMCSYLSDDPKIGPNQFKNYNLMGQLTPTPTYFQFEEIPDDFFYLYEFKPTDTFILNIAGDNRLYELQKEQESLALTKKSIASADAAVIWAKISVIVSVVLFVIGKLLG